MYAEKLPATGEINPSADQRVILNDVSWSQYEMLLAMRGDRSGVRLSYLRGDLELMSPSLDHEHIKKTLARLLEAYGDEYGIDLIGYGSWTVRNAPNARGLEPDECYVIGPAEGRPERPDLALEVVWTSGGLDKLEIYRGLGVPEVWIWRDGALQVHILRGDAYERAERSVFAPDIDLAEVASYLTWPNQARAAREYRAALRARRGKAD